MTIKELRTKLGLSQRDFSKAAGIARSALQKYENGESRPTTMVLQRIWEKFGCVVDHNMIYWVKGDEKGEIPIWD